MIRSTWYLFLLAILVFCTPACKDEPADLTDFPNGCDYMVGEYSLIVSSYDSIPYEGVEKVVFKDSLGNELVFTNTVEEKIHYPVTLIQDDYRYCYYKDSKKYSLRNDSLKLEIEVYLHVNLSVDDQMSVYVSDIMAITLKQELGPPFYLPVSLAHFSKTINQRTSPTVLGFENLDSLVCYDKVFYNVEFINNPFFHTFNFFYRFPEGIVSFKDRDDKRWRLERFE